MNDNIDLMPIGLWLILENNFALCISLRRYFGVTVTVTRDMWQNFLKGFSSVSLFTESHPYLSSYLPIKLFVIWTNIILYFLCFDIYNQTRNLSKFIWGLGSLVGNVFYLFILFTCLTSLCHIFPSVLKELIIWSDMSFTLYVLNRVFLCYILISLKSKKTNVFFHPQVIPIYQ